MNGYVATIAALVLACSAGWAYAADNRDGDETVRRAVHVCEACHGPDAKDAAATQVPRLAGQPAQYLIAQLRAFRAEKRSELDTQAYMWGVSALLDDATIRGLADYYAEQIPPPGKPGDAVLIERGRRIYVEGVPDKGVRSCASCHGDNAEGETTFPRLAGQQADYVVRQFNAFITRLRPHGTLMAKEIRKLPAEDLRAVAEYVQSR